MRKLWMLTILALVGPTGCPQDEGDDDSGDDDTADVGDDETSPPEADENWDRDVLHTALDVDLTALHATATVRLEGDVSTAASFEAGGLQVSGVTDGEGAQLEFRVEDGRLDVGVPSTEGPTEIVVEYDFEVRQDYDGYMDSGMTFVWPYYCGNLFPCHSDPADGTTFDLALAGVPDGEVAVFPDSIPGEAPSYQIAWVHGDLELTELGATSAGTALELWTAPEDTAAGITGTANLVATFEWFEQTLGPYPFGDRAGAVGVNWGPGAYGGMEHHPLWHVGIPSLGDEVTQVHEAAHGWYGGGIRIACWEDFVLSEGTVTYLAARAIEEAVGPAAGALVWADYQDTLNYVLAFDDRIAWPEGCGEVDILADGLFSLSPYYKGAFFYLDVADQVGADVLDGVLASFFAHHGGDTAGMQDMLDHIEAETGFDPTELAESWLRTPGAPG